MKYWEINSNNLKLGNSEENAIKPENSGEKAKRQQIRMC